MNESFDWNVEFFIFDIIVFNENNVNFVNISELNDSKKLEYCEKDCFLIFDARFLIILMHNLFNFLHVSEDQVIQFNKFMFILLIFNICLIEMSFSYALKTSLNMSINDWDSDFFFTRFWDFF
jgi:hypothetical protein